METNTPGTTYPFLAGEGEMAILTRAFDWANTSIGSPSTWPQSLRTTVSTLLSSRFPMFLWWGPDLIQFYNDAYRPSLGNTGKHPLALGQPGEDCWPEIWPTIKPLIDQVLAGGEAIWSENQLIPIYRNGRMEDVYWTFGYSSVRDETGQLAGVMVICTETTQTVLAQQHLEESGRQLLASFEQSPVAVAIISDPDLTFRMANSFYGQLVGRPPDKLIGKPLLEALPELQGQGFDQLLKRVLTTGTPYIANEVAADIIRNDQLETIYINLTYQPRYEANRNTGTKSISGILVVATDVTQQVRSRQQVEASEKRFRSLLKEAPVAMSLFVGREMVITYPNERMLKIWGKGDAVTGKPLREALPELEGQPFLQLLDDVYTTGIPYHASGDRGDLVVDGHLNTYYFNFTYEPIRDENGQIYAVLDVAIDVTEQVLTRQQIEESEARYRQLSQELDERVQQRTGELRESNRDLMRSNKNLEQFAYVASHDLQEPLRKIQQFSDLLTTQYAAQLGEGVDYLRRMQLAASRMSVLIKDLLTFSRISTRQESTAPVSLTQVVTEAVENLAMAIQEAGAQVDVHSLPTVQGDASQLGQLFQNLLSNALKFHRAGTVPQVWVSAEQISAAELPASMKPARRAAFYDCIRVSDNGIGFDDKYVDRIFQVFQRLHGRNEFAGTGVGLAICEKVAANHGGAITAYSQSGQGATFLVYLPILK